MEQFRKGLRIKRVLNKEKLMKIKSLKINKESFSSPFKILTLSKKLLKGTLNIKNCNLKLFENLGFKKAGESKDKLYFLVPLKKEKLVKGIDLIEECCKALKYENFKLDYPLCFTSSKASKKKNVELIKKFFLSLNYTEVFSNSLVSGSQNDIISLINPLSKDLKNLNKSLILNHIAILKSGKEKYKKQKKIFEISRIFKIKTNKLKEADFIQCTALIEFTKKELLLEWIDLKANFDRLFYYFNIKNFKSFIQEGYFNENIILYKINNVTVARLLIIKDEVEIAKQGFFVFQLNLSLFFKALSLMKAKNIKHFSRFPGIEKDFSYSSKKEINLYKLKNDLLNSFKHVNSVNFFDLYINKEVSKFGVRIKFQSEKETLNNFEIEKEINIINNFLKKKYNISPIN